MFRRDEGYAELPQQDIELQEVTTDPQEQARITNNRLAATAGIVDGLNLTAIYAMFTRAFWQKALEEMGKFVLFPVVAAISIIQAVLAWRGAYLNNNKPRFLVHAGVETGVALAITTAVVGALVFPTAFALATPLIFACTVGAKTVYHAGASLYFAGKAAGAREPHKKIRYNELAKNNGIATGIGTLVTIATTAVFVFGMSFLAGIGIAAGALGAGFAAYRGVSSFFGGSRPATDTITPVDVNGEQHRLPRAPSNDTLGIHRRLSNNGIVIISTRSPSPAPALPPQSSSPIFIPQPASNPDLSPTPDIIPGMALTNGGMKRNNSHRNLAALAPAQAGPQVEGLIPINRSASPQS